MNPKYFLSILLILLPAFSVSCVSTPPMPSQIHYYALEYTPPGSFTGPESSCILGIRTFSVAPSYDTSKIIYSEQSMTRQSYHYHRWQSDPGEMIAYLIRRDFQNSGLFQGVLDEENMQEASHVLMGSVDEFFEQDELSNIQAVLSLSITLWKKKKNKFGSYLCFQKSYSRREKVAGRTPVKVVEAMSRALRELSGQIIADTYNAVSKDACSPDFGS